MFRWKTFPATYRCFFLSLFYQVLIYILTIYVLIPSQALSYRFSESQVH